jgi:hypothetical protein
VPASEIERIGRDGIGPPGSIDAADTPVAKQN